MAEFEVRALEIHSQYAWNFEWVSRAIRFMKAHELNTLILHRNDFLELIIYPGKYFGCKKEKYASIFERYQEIFRQLYKFTPTRRSGPYQRRAYFKRILEEARRAGIKVYIENKELYFPDIILEFFPQLVKAGKICATDPFWLEFIRIKYDEFFEEFPEVGGIITALSTGESRVSISSNRCTCDRCQNTSPKNWYHDVIMAMFEPIQSAGKKLFIRDFVFSAKTHQEIAATMQSLPEAIGMTLKNTPHDYYPTFPDNPRIGQVGNREQWVEYDVWGQYFGWGIAPAIIIDDMRKRMRYAKARGATGVMFRVDWESLDGHSSWDTLNQINLYAGASLSLDLEASAPDICQQWIEENGHYQANALLSEKIAAANWLSEILGRTWDVVSKTCFVNECVFSDSTHLPVSLEHALWLAEEKNSLKEWRPEKTNAMSTDDENLEKIMAEKDEALALVNALASRISAGNSTLSVAANQYLDETFNVFVRYVKAFRLATSCIFLTRAIIDRAGMVHDGKDKTYLNRWSACMRELDDMIVQFEHLFSNTSYYYRAYTLLDADRLRALRADLAGRVKDLTQKKTEASSSVT